jgi:ubiquitin carboxyl-terminal hydrolase 5/13
VEELTSQSPPPSRSPCSPTWASRLPRPVRHSRRLYV